MRISKYIQALAILIGTIVGVGLFGLPYITSKVGLWVMIAYFIALGIVVVLACWLYGEITLRTVKLCRLPGYADQYLGPWAKKLSFVSTLFGGFGASLAYIIVGGGFFYSFFNPLLGGSEFTYTFLYFALGAALILFGIKSIAKTEVVLLSVLLVILGFSFFRGYEFIEFSNLFNFDKAYLFLPYGATLFALAGISIIPEIKEFLKGEESILKKVSLIGVVVSIAIYLFFIILVVGICGFQTSNEAISGLQNILGNGVVAAMFLFGILTTFTSFIASGLNLKMMLLYDLKVNKYLAWLIACFVPFILYLIGVGNFIAVISVTGGVFLALDVILIILIYLEAKKTGELKPAYSINLPRIIIYFLIILFVLGAVYEIMYFI